MPRFSLLLLLCGISSISGQVQFAYDAHILNGQQIIVTDFYDCFDWCASIPHCVAVDWNRNNDECFWHDVSTGCSDITFNRPGIDTYRLSQCPSGTRISPLPQYGYTPRDPPGPILAPGDILEGGSDPQNCIQYCIADPGCTAVAYNPTTKQCMTTNSYTEACNPRQAGGAWTLYNFDICILPDIPSGTSSPTCVTTPPQTMDLIFVIDSSASICSGDPTVTYVPPQSNGFVTCDIQKEVIDFIANLVGSIPIGNGNSEVKVGIITFADDAVLELNLSDNGGVIGATLDALKKRGNPYGRTNTNAALRLLRTRIVNNLPYDRPGIPNVAIIITDEKPNVGGDINTELSLVRAAGVTLYAVGPGSNADRSYLATIPQDSKEDVTFFVRPVLSTLSTQLQSLVSGGAVGASCPSTPSCEKAQLDIVIALDMSGSICSDEPEICERWINMTRYIEELVDKVPIGTRQTQVGLLLFSTNAKIMWQMNVYSSKLQLKTAIQSLKFEYRGGETNTAQAIQTATNMFTKANGDRPSAYNVIILITDSIPNLPTTGIAGRTPEAEAIRAAKTAKDHGVQLYAVAVKPSSSRETIAFISELAYENRQDEYWFLALVPGQLHSVLNKVINKACASPVIVAPVKCEQSNMDLTFVLDASGSVCNQQASCSNWDSLIDFVKSVVDDTGETDPNNKLLVGPSNNQIGVVMYSTTAQIVFDMNRYKNRADTVNAIEALRGGYTGGLSNMYRALEQVEEMYDSNERGNRNTARDVVIFITDGFANEDTSKTFPKAEELKAKGIQFLVVGVGSAVQATFLQDLSSAPQIEDQDYYLVQSYQKLDVRLDNIVNRVCEQQEVITPAPDQCEKPMDLIFILDGSGSLCDTDLNYQRERGTCGNWETVLEFIKDVVRTMNIGRGTGQSSVALAIYASQSGINWELYEHTTLTKLLTAIDNLKEKFPGGTTNTAAGLQTAVKLATNWKGGDRLLAGILVTDSLPNEDQQFLAGNITAAQATMKMYAVRPNDAITLDSLKEMSSPPRELNKNYYGTLDAITLSDHLKKARQDSCKVDTESPLRTTRESGVRTTTAVTKCDAGIDLVMLVDVSGSICDKDPDYVKGTYYCKNWQNMVDFMVQVVRSMNPSRDRVGVVLFSSSVFPRFELGEFTNFVDIEAAVASLSNEYMGGETKLSLGIRHVDTSMFNGKGGDRLDAANVLLILTDGIPNNPGQSVDLARELHTTTRVYPIGVGAGIDFAVLSDMSNEPHTEGLNYFTVNQFAGLQDVLSAFSTQLASCPSPTPRPTPAASTDRVTQPSTRTRTTSTTTTPSPRDDCKVDLLFILDGSGSVCDEDLTVDWNVYYKGCDNWKAQLNYLIQLVENLNDVGNQGTLVSLIVFGDKADLTYGFNKYSNKGDIVNAIRNARYPGGFTHLADALEVARLEAFNPHYGERLDADNKVLIVTDGAPNKEEANTIPFGTSLKRSADAQIYIVGIANQKTALDIDIIAQLSSPPNSKDDTWFVVNNHQSLNMVQDEVIAKIYDRKCYT